MGIILGLNAYHGDSSACLLRDGKVVAAAEEERYQRIKHWAGFPMQAVHYCLDFADISIADVDIVAVNSDPKANLLRKAAYVLSKKPDLELVQSRLQKAKERVSIVDLLNNHFPNTPFRGKVQRVEHHRAHLASAYLASPFSEAVILSLDGFGDFSSAAWGMGRGSDLQVDGNVFFPHSLGIFYQALTQFLGFDKYGDEYKIMGLAAYGNPGYLDKMGQIVKIQKDGTYRLNLDYFRHHNKNFTMSWSGGSPTVGRLYSGAMEELFGAPRAAADPLEQKHMDMACSIQAMFEKALFSLLNSLHTRYGSKNLAFAGGCAMNSAANGQIRSNTPFRNLYIPAAAADAGGALGAALSAWHASRPELAHGHITTAYLGNGYSDAQIAATLDQYTKQLAVAGCTVKRSIPSELLDDTVEAIDSGLIVGWFQGRMEWGARALGSRSILADPRRADMRDHLNKKIKLREPFRPLAPVILREAVGEWFTSDHEVPFMSEVYSIRQEKRSLIPAVTHVDGSGRLQSVAEDSNPLYYQLIQAFGKKTGVPILLNTSFNENEPIVCTPQEALNCFLRTKMDLLVIGPFIVRRNGKGDG